jgi:hypothetical protein
MRKWRRAITLRRDDHYYTYLETRRKWQAANRAKLNAQQRKLREKWQKTALA